MFRVINCLSGAHDLRLVVLAGFVCFFASFVGINLLGRARAAQGHTRMAWLALAATATGCGIWATHFFAMLAYEPGVLIAFDIGFTGLSLIFAATITGIAFSIAVKRPSPRGAGGRRRRPRRRQHALYRHVGAGSAGPRHLGAEPGDRIRRDRDGIRERRDGCGYLLSRQVANLAGGVTAHARDRVTSLHRHGGCRTGAGSDALYPSLFA